LTTTNEEGRGTIPAFFICWREGVYLGMIIPFSGFSDNEIVEKFLPGIFAVSMFLSRSAFSSLRLT
jgi:hypothetical protein